jgi:hypothetical protein
VKVRLTIEVRDIERRTISAELGNGRRLATREEVRAWCEALLKATLFNVRAEYAEAVAKLGKGSEPNG